MIDPRQRQPIDRAKIERPAGFDVELYAVNLTGPVKIAFDDQGNILVAEGGYGGEDVHIFGFKPTSGKIFDVYPLGRKLPFGLIAQSYKIHGPIGGMLWHNGRIYISHRDENDMGVITAIDYTGGHQTIVAGLPAQGELGVTDMAIDPRTGRLFFGVGTATNSSVVGLDDFQIGWPQKHPEVHDLPWKTLRLLGKRFDTPNPNAGLLGPADIAVSASFQPFGQSNKTTIPGVSPQEPKFNGGIFSVPANGGEIRVEAHGIHYPRGLAFNEYGQLYFTNDGMELRGTRPVKDDPDCLLRMVPGAYFGWPDYSTDLRPISDARFQPPLPMIIKSGYPDLGSVVDMEASNLHVASPADVLQSVFPSQSGAAGLAFIPGNGPFKGFVGDALVALSGDRAPFATNAQKLLGPVGYKVMRVDFARNQAREFVRNVQGKPASMIGNDPEQLERPIDVRFGPDGALYILDFGQMSIKNGRPVIVSGTGKIFRVAPVEAPRVPTAAPSARQTPE